MEFNKLVFPAPDASYDKDLPIFLDEPSSLIFIPRKPVPDSPSKTTSSFTSSKKNQKEFVPCLYLPHIDESHKYSNLLMIYFHGNAEDIYLAYDLLKSLKKELKMNILAVEYPGYGLYPGETKADRICEDSEIVYDFLLKEVGFSENKIIIFGRSIGTGPATHLASKRNPAALILMSAYLSIKTVVTHLVSKWLSWAVAERFENYEKIQKVKCPVFFLHGKMDDLIPCEHSKTLYNRTKVGEFWFPNKMTHNSFNILSDLLIPIDTFLDKYKIKVRMEERESFAFPQSVFNFPYEEKNTKGGHSGFISSIYNRIFDKK